MDIWRIRATGGDPERMTNTNADIRYLAPIDDRTIVYTSPDQDGAGPWLWALDTATRRTQRISSGLEVYTSVDASGDGRRLVATVSRPTANLWAIPLRTQLGRRGGREALRTSGRSSVCASLWWIDALLPVVARRGRWLVALRQRPGGRSVAWGGRRAARASGGILRREARGGHRTEAGASNVDPAVARWGRCTPARARNRREARRAGRRTRNGSLPRGKTRRAPGCSKSPLMAANHSGLSRA